LSRNLEDLDGDGFVEVYLGSAVNHAKTAFANDAFDLVSSVKNLPL
jgi:hypothetical protein